MHRTDAEWDRLKAAENLEVGAALSQCPPALTPVGAPLQAGAVSGTAKK